MKRFVSVLVLLVMSIALFSVSFVRAQGDPVPYLILLRGNSIPANFEANVQNAGGQVMHMIPQVGIVTVLSSNPDFASLMSGVQSVQEIGALPTESLPQAVAEMPAEVPVSPSAFYDQGLLWGINRVNAPAAWEAGYTGSHNTVVAVIDTGIAWNHPDLASNVVYVDCFTSTGSYASGGCNPYPAYSDHGTHVAGTIAANFGGGVVGVGPNLGLAGYNTFEPIPGCGVCSYSSSRWLAEIDAAERGFDVINMSLGSLGQYGGGNSSGLATFVAADNRVANLVISMGTTIVASAGNSAVDLNGTFINIPGGLPGIVNVAATGIQPAPRYPYPDAFDVQAFYSNQGASVDIAAPGGDCGQIGFCDPATRPANWFEYLVLSSTVTPNVTCAATASCPVGWGWKGGTSMASPHVAGVAGLVIDQNPNLRPNQVVALLRRTAENLGNRQVFGHGMVDAAAALGVD